MTSIKNLIPSLPTLSDIPSYNFLCLPKAAFIQAFNRELTSRNKDASEFLGQKSRDGRFPLHFVFLSNDPEWMYGFLRPKSKIGPNSGDSASITPFHLAALAGKSGLCTMMSEDGGDANQGNKDGVTAFMLACVSGSKETVEILSEKGNPSQGTNSGYNLLHFAAFGDSSEVVELCLNLGVQFHGDNKGYTPIHLAAEFGLLNSMQIFAEKLPQFLMQRDKNGQSPLDIVSESGNAQIISLFKNITEMQVNEGNSDGFTPLHRAAGNGYAQCCAELIKLQANPIQANCVGETPIHLAATNGHHGVIKEIYSKSDKKLSFTGNNDWNTPLHLACKNGHLNSAYCLVKKEKENLNIPNKAAYTPLDLACQFGSIPLVAMLLDNGSKCTSFVFQSSIAHKEVMELVLCHFPTEPNHKDLEKSIIAESKDSTELLLKSGIVPKIDHTKLAASQEDKSILDLLIKWGAKVSQEIVDEAHVHHKQYLSGLLNNVPNQTPEEYLDYNRYEQTKLLGLYQSELDSNLVL